MFFSQHVYFLSAVLFFLLWLLLFTLNNKTDRRTILTVSFVTLVLGFFVEQMHLVDWWHPIFVFNSTIKIEDVLFGFSCGGDISGIYCLLTRGMWQSKPKIFKEHYKIVLTLVSLFCLFGLFYLFHIRSFWSSIFALSVPVITVLFWKPRVIPIVFLTGCIITFIALLGYLFAIRINPNYVTETYNFHYLSGRLFLGIPIEELWWFFFAGIGIASFQEIIWGSK
jgi:hypothetical protein